MLKKFYLLIFFVFLNQIKAQNEFITIWKPNVPHPFPALGYQGITVPSTDSQIWLPSVGTNYQIYWEEIGFPSHNATLTNVNSTYQVLVDFGTPLNPNSADATYRVKISNGNGTFHRIRFSNWDLFINGDGIVGDAHKISNVEQWGNIHWSSMEQAFQACRYMDVTATDTPDFSNVTDMSNMFAMNYNLVGNPSFNNWDTSHVTTFLSTFSGCFVFNQPIGNWDTSNVTMMGVMFSSALKFNQPIGNWNTSKVDHMTAMFTHAKEFNQPIGNWDLSNVIDCEFMFSQALAFNQPIGNWNTSKVVEMDRMFNNAKTFNQDISAWNTGKVTNMEGMFAGAENFNQDISNWDVSKVEYMQFMFNGASKFNQNIGSWNVGNVGYMNSMFQNAAAFNQNLGDWNVSKVKYMSDMFNNAVSFNQDLGKWNLALLQSAANIFRNTAINCQNYDSTLQGWRLNPSTPNNINISLVSPLTYSHPAAVNARNYLISNKGWTISGDTYDGECQSFLATTDVKTKENEVSIYPNPATDFIYVKNLDKAKNYTIFDQSGRIVLTGILSGGQINIQSLTTGNYVLQIISNDQKLNFKFIKK